jgi:DNA-binding transcriptional regulator LsrR (DeoR family)
MAAERLREYGVKDEITGEVYLTKKMTRRVLGRALRVSRMTQTRVIRELKSFGLIEIIHHDLIRINDKKQ